jgi:hypothetical protein
MRAVTKFFVVSKNSIPRKSSIGSRLSGCTSAASPEPAILIIQDNRRKGDSCGTGRMPWLQLMAFQNPTDSDYFVSKAFQNFRKVQTRRAGRNFRQIAYR